MENRHIIISHKEEQSNGKISYDCRQRQKGNNVLSFFFFLPVSVCEFVYLVSKISLEPLETLRR